MHICHWIQQHLDPQPSTTDAMIYEDMESQSAHSLIPIYRPFDAARRTHWAARGSALDFLAATAGDGGRLLDFGPGDGWPSLLVAERVDEVVGVDSSWRRVCVCRANAERLGIKNARFRWYRAGDPLPFSTGTFDGVMAASSVEQTPDPQRSLAEIHRVLRPGGRLRLGYEALTRYREGRERELTILECGGDVCKLLLYYRDIARERVVQYGVDVEVSRADLIALFGTDSPQYDDLTIEMLERLEPAVIGTGVVETSHPCGRTWVEWLQEAGFSSVRGTHEGSRGALVMYDWMGEAHRPLDIAGVDNSVRPAVELAVSLECPLSYDPRITAVK